jgi:hypothetical protein
MLNMAILKSPWNWVIVTAMVLLALIAFNVVKKAASNQE